MKKWMTWGAGLLIGATSGYLYWYYVGCTNGSCAITSSPVSSTIYGGVMGLLLVSSFGPGEKKKDDHQ